MSFVDQLCGARHGNDEERSDPGVVKDGIIRNAGLTTDKLLEFTSAGEDIKTLFDTFQFGVARNPKADALGKRKDINSPYEWKTFEEVSQEADALGSFLAKLGLKRCDRVGLSGKNAPEYLTAINGCFQGAFTTVPIYDTFGEVECKYIMEQAEVKCLFISRDNLEKVLDWTKDNNNVKKLIVWGGVPEGVKNEKVISYEDAVEEGKANLVEPNSPKPDELAIIMYTSGTT